MSKIKSPAAAKATAGRKKLKIRKGDMVAVISGKDKGKQGKVLNVLTSAGKVVVEKVNMIKRHTKPSQKLQQGGIIEKAAPLAVAKVMLVAPGANKPTRISRKQLKDGKWVRYSRKFDEVLDK